MRSAGGGSCSPEPVGGQITLPELASPAEIASSSSISCPAKVLCGLS